MNKYIRLFNTIKYLKYKQIYFRLFYFIRNRYKKKIGSNYPSFSNIKVNKLKLDKSIASYKFYLGKNKFCFLNLEKSFAKIDWNYNTFGKLWTYNITYFDFLHQEDISIEESIELIDNFINTNNLKDAKEPFPISLRGLNWIKFFVFNNIQNPRFNSYLYTDYQILMDNLEYHLLGNHLLENGYSLLFAAYYFEDEKFYTKAKEILVEELNEQILNDGAHFELSPMYHKIMLYRILDCINLVKNNHYKDRELLDFFKEKASLMLSWLENVSYKNGDIPLLNDSANNIAPSSKELFSYAKKLDVTYEFIPLKDSGYRKTIRDNYECIVDVGNIGPDYIPGHAHSDTFSFELYLNGIPFIVDTGTSTYETNDKRAYERSTISHNTVMVEQAEQSEIWGGFRVANRAKIINLTEDKDFIQSTHDGYRNKFGLLHTRKWKFEENKIIITDLLSKKVNATFRLHFHPDVKKEDILNKIKLNNLEYNLTKYEYAPEFNKTKESLVLEVSLEKELSIEINI